MASRMERYYNAEERSKKNKSLYNQINNLENYSNIESVVDISNSNEININTIKKLIGKENDTKVSKVKQVDDFQEKRDYIDEKNYDLNDVLKKAKHGHSDKDIKHRKLRIHQYEILKKLKEEQPDNEKIDELLNTMAISDTSGDDLGFFDDLKSNTMIGTEAGAIKDVLDEAKEDLCEYEEETTEEDSDTTPLNNLDKSFYTASFNFSDKDFDDLKNLDDTIKKNNKLIRILIILFSITIAIIILIVVAKLIVF